MRKSLLLTIGLALTFSTLSFAGVVTLTDLGANPGGSHTGAFTVDDDMEVFTFTLTGPNNYDFSARTTSFATGGFQPILSLYYSLTAPDGGGIPDPNSGLYTFDASGGSAPGACDGRGIDPATSSCLDSLISLTLSPSYYYTLVLTENYNTGGGTLSSDASLGNLGDQFSQYGTGSFTQTFCDSPEGNFYLVSNNCGQRTGAWAFTLTSDEIIPPPPEEGNEIPEPASVWLLGTGVVMIVGGAIRRNRANR